MNMRGLEGKIALVTGGNRGIGAACSLALAEAGCEIAVNFRSRSEEAQKIVLEIRGLGQKAITAQADVSRSAEVTAMVKQIEQDLGPVDILVNNAGIAR